MTFSHDGLRDSLTHLAAPPYFYENLRRDLATAERNRSQIKSIEIGKFSRKGFRKILDGLRLAPRTRDIIAINQPLALASNLNSSVVTVRRA